MDRESTIIKCHLTKFRGRCDQACQFDNDCVRHRSRLRSCRLLTFFHVRSLDGELAVKNSFLLALCGSQCIFLIVFLMACVAAKTALTFYFVGETNNLYYASYVTHLCPTTTLCDMKQHLLFHFTTPPKNTNAVTFSIADWLIYVTVYPSVSVQFLHLNLRTTHHVLLIEILSWSLIVQNCSCYGKNVTNNKELEFDLYISPLLLKHFLWRLVWG